MQHRARQRLDQAADSFRWMWDEWIHLHLRGGDWPRHVFVPTFALMHPAGSVFERLQPDVRAAMRKMSQPQLATFIGLGTMLATWRISQGIYRVDPSLYAALIDTPMAEIPVAVLYRMPEWAIYIETPGLVMPERATSIHGVWVRHDIDFESGTRPLLQIVIDTDEPASLFSHLVASIPLGPGSVADCIAEATRKWRATVGGNAGRDEGFVHDVAAWMNPVMNLLLYICSAADFTSEEAPAQPAYVEPVKTKRGLRFFPPPQPRQWNVGLRMGAALRMAEAEQWNREREPHGGSVPPHMRRAHWHGVWTGPKAGPRKFKLNWWPPLPINMHVNLIDTLPAVIRPVKE